MSVPWKKLKRANITPTQINLIGLTVDIQLTYDPSGAGRLIGDWTRLHMSQPPDQELQPLCDGWFRRFAVGSVLDVRDGCYAMPGADLGPKRRASYLAIGLPENAGLYVWAFGYRPEECDFIFIIDEHAGVEWIVEDL